MEDNFTENDNKRKRHSYISLACAFCKRRHFKCDGNPEGCNNCNERGMTCEYPPKEKRGPKRKRSLDNDVKSESFEGGELAIIQLEESKRQTNFWRDKFYDLMNAINLQSNVPRNLQTDFKLSPPQSSPTISHDFLLPWSGETHTETFDSITDINNAVFYLPRSLAMPESQLSICQRVSFYRG